MHKIAASFGELTVQLWRETWRKRLLHFLHSSPRCNCEFASKVARLCRRGILLRVSPSILYIIKKRHLHSQSTLKSRSSDIHFSGMFPWAGTCLRQPAIQLFRSSASARSHSRRGAEKEEASSRWQLPSARRLSAIFRAVGGTSTSRAWIVSGRHQSVQKPI